MMQIQRAVLDCVAADDGLQKVLVLRGGGALRLFYGGVRESTDLDFLVQGDGDAPASSQMQNELKRRLNTALNQHLPRHFPGPPQWKH